LAASARKRACGTTAEQTGTVSAIWGKLAKAIGELEDNPPAAAGPAVPVYFTTLDPNQRVGVIHDLDALTLKENYRCFFHGDSERSQCSEPLFGKLRSVDGAGGLGANGRSTPSQNTQGRSGVAAWRQFGMLHGTEPLHNRDRDLRIRPDLKGDD